MANVEAIKTTTPSGSFDNVLRMTLDAQPNGYRLSNLINKTGDYFFTIWYKSDANSKITFNVLGESEQVDSSSQWKKYSKQVNVSDVSNNEIVIIPSVNSITYFYEAYLSEGKVDTSWTPAPEDDLENIEQVKSEIKQTAEKINLSIESLNGDISRINVTVGQIEERVETVDGRVTEVIKKADGIEQTVQTQNGKISNIEQKADRIDQTVSDHGERMTAVEQKAESIRLKAETNEGAIASIRVDAQTINQTVSDVQGKQSEILQKVDKIIQDVKDTNGKFGKLEVEVGKINGTVGSLQGKQSSIEQTVSGIDISFSELSKKIGNSFLFKEDGLYITSSGTGNTKISLKISNDRISFLSGNSEVAYISDNELHITYASVIDSIRLGNFAFEPMSNGSLSFNRI